MAKTATATVTKTAPAEVTRKTRDMTPVEVSIEKNVPMPESRKGLRPYVGRYPFDKLEVGNSFAIPVKDGEDSSAISTHLSAAARSYSRARHDNLFAFMVLTQTKEDGSKEVRIWRKPDAPPRAMKPRAKTA